MTSSPRIPLLAVAAAGLALAAPAAAQAADAFVGVTGGDRLVHFTSDALPGLSEAAPIAGLPRGERLVALDARPSGELMALGASGALFGLDAKTPVITRTVARLGAPVAAGSPATLSVAAGGATVRVIAAGLAPRRYGRAQSRLLRYDPATGKLRGQDSFLPIQLDAIAATGTAPDDTSTPRVTVRIPRQTVRSALKRRGFLAIVTTSEPGQTVMSARVGSRYRAFGIATAEHDGRLTVLARARQSQIRAVGGRRIRLHIAVHDYAGHAKLVDRWFTLGR